MIDLRSDTVTKPSPEMLEYMSHVSVGDDVFGEDETVNAFQTRVATMFGKKAGLFVPSGVMSNQLALNVLTNSSEEILTEENSHIFNYETAATALLSGAQIRPILGKNGKLSPNDLRGKVRGAYDWEPKTSVLSLENSTNRGGGYCYTKDELANLRAFCMINRIQMHIDGARIWNAHVATGIPFSYFGGMADTISVCFSKGLGAPVGSMLLGSTSLIARAKRMRKMWGGGMRQVGLLAAAAEFALDNNLSKLAIDHEHAKAFAKALNENPAFSIDSETVQTNILIFDVVDGRSSEDICAFFQEHGVRMIPFGEKRIRAVFHFQVSSSDVDKAVEVLKKV